MKLLRQEWILPTFLAAASLVLHVDAVGLRHLLQVQKEGQSIRSEAVDGRANDENKTETGAEKVTTAAQAKMDYGDLTCMRWTGGTCLVSGCFEDRGPTVCENSRCMCPPDYCASSWGVCEPGLKGEGIGTHAIRFVNAYDESNPYMGMTTVEAGVISSEHDIPAAVSGDDDSAQWKMVRTPNGFVRFESVAEPDHVLTIYYNRRRRSDFFVQSHAQGSAKKAADTQAEAALNASSARNASADDQRVHGEHIRSLGEMQLASVSLNATREEERTQQHAVMEDQKKKTDISDDADLWPRLRPLKDTTPVAASFQVREREGGIEIWDPEWSVAIASASKDWWFEDEVANHGVAECYPKSALFTGCSGRELVAFEPPLPEEALSHGERQKVDFLKNLTPLMTLGIGLGVFVTIFAITFGCLYYSTSMLSMFR